MDLTAARLKRLLAGPPDVLREQAFNVLASISAIGSDGSENLSRDLLIRSLDRREDFSSFAPLLDALVRRHGLFPYVYQPDELGAADRFAYEMHRPVGLDDLVFHSQQGQVYRLLAEGRNVVLSAPTSFGKSLIIDGIIATERYDNIVLVVPTIALIDETRRRLTRRFSSRYKIVTHPGQPPGLRTIYVLTQERVLNLPLAALSRLDFFAIDEFYKLDSPNDERSALLNCAFHRLHSTGAQFYLLGPNIDGLAEGLNEKLDFHFIGTDFQTVALETEIHAVTKSSLRTAVLERCRTLTGPTILYVRSPARAREVAAWLVEAGIGQTENPLNDAADWVTATYHPQWFVAKALRQGIGIHHARIPRALAHHMVRLFNEGRLPWLVVTSTLIEGVNTAAENIVIVDNKIAKKNLDFFTYNNIRGRCGRMFKHYVGKVIVYGNPPNTESKVVDIPAYSQGPGASTGLLIQLPWNELNQKSRERLRHFYEQNVISLDVIRAAVGVDPDRIVEVAKMLDDDPQLWSRRLAWTGLPTYEQLVTVSELIYKLSGTRGLRDGVASGRQLAMRLNMLRRHVGDIAAMAQAQVFFHEGNADMAVEDALAFIRQWASHIFPRHLMVLESIARDVFRRHHLPVGDYRYYASAVDSQFLPPLLTTLEEYGLPSQLTLRLLPSMPALRSGAQLDDVLAELRQLHPVKDLTPFEREILEDTIAGL